MNVHRITIITGAAAFGATTLLTGGVAHAGTPALDSLSTGSATARPSDFDLMGAGSGSFTPPNPSTSASRLVSVENFSDRDLTGTFVSYGTTAPDLKGKNTVIVVGPDNDFSFRYQDSRYGLPVANGVNLRVYINRAQGVSASCDADVLSLFTCTVHQENVEGQPSYAFEISPK